MSEIFNWFKRAEMDKRKVLTDIPMEPIVIFPTNSDEDAANPILDQEIPDTSSAKIEIRSTARLNLDLAEYNVKNGLDSVTLVGEQFRLLRAKLSLMKKQRGIKTLLITSAGPSEGKTFTACVIAGVLAQEPGRRVLLVDGDLRRPKAGRDLGMPNHQDIPGLSDVLRGNIGVMDALLSSSDTNLFMLPSGKPPTHPAELLSSPLLESSIKTLSGYFDWVVIDSPPVVALADPSIIAPICHAVLLVVQANQTPAKMVKECIKRIGPERICGVILNRAKHIKSSQYYYHYYHQHTNGNRKK
jgi:capsular exopolysaccharide synthesis family protein